MIINLRFGYAARHQIYYDIERKRGTLKLWSSYSGSIMGADPMENHKGSLSTLTPPPEAQRETLFRANQQTEFLITDEKDLLSILASLAAVVKGDASSFTSKEGRKISLSLRNAGKCDKDVITVKIQYGKAAKLTIGEAHKLRTIVRQILRDLGYLDQKISEQLERIPQGSPN